MELSKEEYKQYSRHILLDTIGEAGQLKLKKARVLVIGAGGLGCPILQYLTAAGVGTIGIIDHDRIDQSNLQRQVLYTMEDIGEYKALTAQRRLAKLNPYINFEVHVAQLSRLNALELFEKYDIIVDGSDNFETRYLTNDAAVLTGKPLVYGAIFKFEGQVSVFNYQGSASYRCLYPTPPNPEESPNCSEIGVLGVLPGIIGSLQANEVIKIICGIGRVLTNTLLMYDVLNQRQIQLKYQKTTEAVVTELLDDYRVFCGIPTSKEEQQISWGEREGRLESFQLLDVRALWERDQFNIGGLHIPLAALRSEHHKIPSDQPLVVYCKSGGRSSKAMAVLQELRPELEVYNLIGGMDAVQA